jgi:Fic family protein
VNIRHAILNPREGSGKNLCKPTAIGGMRPHRDKALMLAQREIASLVHNAVELEGIHFTLAEIQTLLGGITVGGHKLSDQKIAVNQGEAWRYLFASIKRKTFAVSADYACELHAIAGSDYIPPPAAELPALFKEMVTAMQQLDDIYDRAIHVFLTMARCQFFHDVNKRMGRFMMNGVLLDAGFPAINLPAQRQLEFNQLMLAFYRSGEQQPMNAFLRSCLDPRIVAIMKE